MATNVQLNGSTYSIPRTGDSSWSASGGVDDYLVALATGVLQKAGGAFTLSAEVDFGASHGLKALYLKSRGTTPATAGVLRLANAEAVSWRNQANSANLDLSVDANNLLTYAGNPVFTLALGAADTGLKMNAGGTAYEWGKLANANIDAAAAIAYSKLAALTASRALVSDGSGVVSVSAVTDTELGYLSGVTSAVQTQLNTNATNTATVTSGLATHIADVANPHAVTKTQVGLGNVDNTSDATKNAAAVTLTNKTIASPTVVTPVIDDYLDINEESAPSTPSSGKVRVYAKTDKKIYTKDSAGTETQVGAGGSGELNLIDNPSDATNWTETGTRFNGYPTTTTTSGDLPLSGIIETAIQIVSSTTVAGDETTDYVSYAFTTPASLAAKLKVEFYMRPGTNFVASEWTVSVYAGSTRQSLSTDSSSLTYLPNQAGKFTTTFDCAASTAYTLRFTRRVAGSAVAATLNLANVIVGPGIGAKGAVVGTYAQYAAVAGTHVTASSVSPTFGTVAAGENLVTITRHGEWAHINWTYRQTTAGTNGTGNYLFIMPSGLTVNTTLLGSDAASSLGVGRGYCGTLAVNDGTNESVYDAFAASSTQIQFRLAAFGMWASTTNQSFGDTALRVGMQVWLPISEWSGSGTVNLAQNDVEYASCSGTWDANSSTTVYGPAGTTMGGTLTSSRVKTITWQTPIQATDTLEVEINDGNGWVKYNHFGLGYVRQNSTNYGIALSPSTATTTVVTFYQYYLPSGATYGAAGADWGSTWKWRVRKTSGGQAVGFGEVVPGTSAGLVSASGLKGKTDGVAVTTGYVGEVVEGAGTTSTIVSVQNPATITLTAGNWIITGKVVASMSSGGASDYCDWAVASSSGTLTGAVSISGQTYGISRGLFVTGTPSRGMGTLTFQVKLTGSQQYWIGTQGAGTGTFYAHLIAVRIA